MVGEEMKPDEIDCFCNDEIKCPHCGYEYSESHEFPDGLGELECDNCGKKFDYERVISVTYTTSIK